jgi:peroxiredoxin
MELKTLSIIAAGILVLTGCSQKADFSINGKLAGANKDSLFIEEMTEKSMVKRSTLITETDGTFSYTDTASNPRLLFVRTAQNEYIMLMALAGEKISVSAEKGKINETITLSGSPQSELILELNKELIRASDILDSIGQVYQSRMGLGNDLDADNWIGAELEKVRIQQQRFVRNFIDKHYAEPSSLLALSHQVNQQSVLNPADDFDLFEKVDAALFKKYPESPIVKNLHKYVEAMRQQIQSSKAQEKTTGAGTLAPEISLPDPDGNILTLSSFRGKIVLLDFWAAWCGPCRRENPNLVAAYKKYHDKGFEIFQVSLDKTKPEWVAAIKQDGLDWIHVSDLKFWSSPVAREYGIESIPASFLLDREGKIIKRNLRGAALEQELSKLFQ